MQMQTMQDYGQNMAKYTNNDWKRWKDQSKNPTPKRSFQKAQKVRDWSWGNPPIWNQTVSAATTTSCHIVSYRVISCHVELWGIMGHQDRQCATEQLVTLITLCAASSRLASRRSKTISKPRRAVSHHSADLHPLHLFSEKLHTIQTNLEIVMNLWWLAPLAPLPQFRHETEGASCKVHATKPWGSRFDKAPMARRIALGTQRSNGKNISAKYNNIFQKSAHVW